MTTSNVAKLNTTNATEINFKTIFPECGFTRDVLMNIPSQFSEHLVIPDADPNYKPDVALLTQAVMWMVQPQERSMWCFGPPGTGKTELWHFICARIGLPLVVISATPDTRTDKLQGKFVLRAGENGVTTEFDLASIADAMKQGVPCLLDEGDKLGPDTAASLHRVAEMKNWLVEDTKEVIRPGNWFRLVVCANTNGREPSPAFPSSRVQDEAFLDRFDFMCFDYLTPSLEVKIIKSIFPDLGLKSVGMMVSCANLLRDATFGAKTGRRRDPASAQGINAKMTLRTLKAWAGHLRLRGYNCTFEDALEPCFLTGLDSMTYNALMGTGGLIRKVLGAQLSKTPLELEGKK